jgi:hypothetical protein
MIPELTNVDHRSDQRAFMAYRLKACCFFIVVFLLCSSGSDGASDKTECKPTREPEILKKREYELRSAASKLLGVFRTRDLEGFFKLVHKDYFSVGEGGNYAARDLREMFKAKHELYCHFFEAECIPVKSEDDRGAFLSFTELAQRRETHLGTVDVWATEVTRPGCSGHVNVVWAAEGTVEPPLNITRFTFTYVHDQWKAVGIDNFVYIRRTTPPSPN